MKLFPTRLAQTADRTFYEQEKNLAQTYLLLWLWQWGDGNVYLLVLSSWKVNIAENHIAAMGL